MNANIAEIIPYFIVLGILFAFIFFSIFMAIKTSKIKKQQKKALKELKNKGLTQQLSAMHTYGLPVAEGLSCTIQAYSDRLEFYSGTTHITLNREKITDMCVKAEAEIQQHYVSSAGGALGGAMLFGPLGAMIGGRTQKKTSKTVTFYLIITYKRSDGVLDYLGFDVTYSDSSARKLVDEFHRLNKNGNVHIDL